MKMFYIMKKVQLYNFVWILCLQIKIIYSKKGSML
jgi:hypothetical protein